MVNAILCHQVGVKDDLVHESGACLSFLYALSFFFFKEIYNIIVSELSMLALSTTLLCKLQVSPCTFYKPGFTCFGSCVLALMDTKLLEGFPKV